MDESIVKHLEQPQVGTLRFSEAIRAGAKLIRESRHTLISGKGCALGAALVGAGLARSDELVNLHAAYPRLLARFALSLDELQHISCLHYTGRLTREEIAAVCESQGL